MRSYIIFLLFISLLIPLVGVVSAEGINLVYENGDIDIIDPRPVYIVSDNIYGDNVDMNRMIAIQDGLSQKGVPATVYAQPCPSAHNEVLLDSNVPEDAVIVEISYMCAGTLNSKGSEWYQEKKANRDVVVINWSLQTKLSEIDYLPRAWDDNFSPSYFRGLKNPLNHLRANGIYYDESRDIDHIVDKVYKISIQKA